MRNSLLATACLAALALGPGRLGAGGEPEIDRLKAKIRQLEKENQALRAELARLKGVSHKTAIPEPDANQLADLRRLAELYQAMQNSPKDKQLRQRAVVLAKALALARPPSVLSWKVLLETGILKDGLPIQDAQELLGPATDQSNQTIGWYFNPYGRHVAPYLFAQKTKGGLSGWKIGRR
jgi:hypothetical protein